MNKINIALLAGGDSSEREVSVGSAMQVYESLDKSKYNVYLVDIQNGDWHYKDNSGKKWQVDKNDFSITIDGNKTLFDYALIMIHGTPGEDGKLQGYLEMMGVSHSACDINSSVITFDKLACKRAIKELGIPLAKEIAIKKGDSIDADKMIKELGLPIFIKPNASGSSCGVTKVTKREQISKAIEDAFKESELVLAEEFIDGREVGCGVLVTKDKEILLPVTEIKTDKEFFDYEAKYTPGGADEITPADLKESIVDKLNEMTLKAYRACNCKGVVRVDFIVTKDEIPLMIEVNSIPGMSAGSIVPKQIAAAGMSMGEVYDIIIKDTYKKRK